MALPEQLVFELRHSFCGNNYLKYNVARIVLADECRCLLSYFLQRFTAI